MSIINVDLINPASASYVTINSSIDVNGTINTLKVIGGNDNTGLGASIFLASGGNYNTAIGNSALAFTTTGTGNVAVGHSALLLNTTGIGNIAIGRDSSKLNTIGSGNVSIGFNTLSSNTEGNGNTTVGELSMLDNTTGFHNSAYGSYALRDNTTGSNNTAIGYNAGQTITTGENNTFIGKNAWGASPTENNTITLGDSNITTLRCQVTSITSLSDGRDKSNIEESTYGLELLKSLKPVTFEWDTRDGSKKGIKDLGFIAQDLKELDDEYLNLVYSENPEKLEATYGRLIPVLVKAIQELTDKVEELEKIKK